MKLRGERDGDKEEKTGNKDRCGRAEKEANGKARQESEETQRHRGLACGPLPPKRKVGGKKMNLTGEGEKSGPKSEKKPYYDRANQKRKAQAEGKVGGGDGVEGSSEDTAPQGRIAQWSGGEITVVFERGRLAEEGGWTLR